MNAKLLFEILSWTCFAGAVAFPVFMASLYFRGKLPSIAHGLGHGGPEYIEPFTKAMSRKKDINELEAQWNNDDTYESDGV